MKSTATFLILSLALLTACGGPPGDKIEFPGVIAGTVIDDYTGEPVSEITVEAVGTSRRDYTDSLGRFRIDNLRLRSHRVTLNSFWYDSSLAWIELTPDQPMVDTVLYARNPRYDTTDTYKQAWAKAGQDIKENRAAHLRLGGHPDFEHPQRIDTALGVPVVGNFTSIVDENMMAWWLGYNDCVADYVEQNGSLPNSRKEWVDQILEPKEFFEESKKLYPTLDGHAFIDTVTAPDDSYRVAFVIRDQLPYLRVFGPEGERDVLLRYWIPDVVQFVFGPPKSYLLIMKTDSEYIGKDGYCVIDYQFGGVIGW